MFDTHCKHVSEGMTEHMKLLSYWVSSALCLSTTQDQVDAPAACLSYLLHEEVAEHARSTQVKAFASMDA